MRIIGIDPGTRVAGYGVLELSDKGVVPLTCGAWDLGREKPLTERLGTLRHELVRVLETWSPTHLAIELAFVADNPRSALLLGHARGVVLVEAWSRSLPITELSATRVKRMVTSQGRAGKETVARCLSQALKISLEDLPMDATDALAIAWCQAELSRLEGLGGGLTAAQSKWVKSQERKRKSQGGGTWAARLGVGG